MRWRSVEVIVKFLGIFAMIPLRVRQAENSFFQDWVLTIPQCERQAQPLLVIAESGDAVFAPAISAAASMVVRQIIPGRASRRIILANCAPLSLRQIGSEELPVGSTGVGKSLFFQVHFLEVNQIDGSP